ncbi:MAG: DNA polymerase III subunit beta [Alphaproteobacteria bacterium]
MKLRVDRAALLKALSHIQSVVERRNTIPILSNVLLDATDGQLKLSATDMDVEIVGSINADIEESGATTAPAHMLYDIIRKLPDDRPVELEKQASSPQLQVKSGRSNFKIGALPVEDFPQLSAGELPTSFTLPTLTLKQIFDRVKFAVSTEETRYYLNGIYLHVPTLSSGAVLRAVATDGHRLARVDVALPEGAANMPGVIIPRKTIAEVRKLMDEGDEQVTVSLSGNKVRFSIGAVVLTSKLIDGTFPDYERVIPTGNNRVMEVDSKIFASVVDRVSTISTEKTRAVKLALHEGGITVSAHSAEAGSAVEEIEASYTDAPMEIGFNSRYLLDIAAQLDGGGCRFSMSDSGSPTVIGAANDESALYVLMPMRV